MGSAVEAMKTGAYDYIEKPFEPEEFQMVFNRATEHARLLKEVKLLRQRQNECDAGEIIGSSASIRKLQSTIQRIAGFDTTVLITGETGTGKELVARAIHRMSKRKDGIFMAVNCAALPESILESELFGHEKGAFTGATNQKKGILETASGGTLFLDEINSTTPNFQAKLLRALEEGTIIRVGGTKPVKIDIRVIAASNINLLEEVRAGRFRADLYYRLNVVNLEIPPLRKRKEDIPLLAHYFLNRFSKKYHKEIKTISHGVMEKLLQYNWPGNVRELENTIERAVLMQSGNELTGVELPDALVTDIEDSDDQIVSIAEMEEALIRRALQRFQGRRDLAASALGISTATLWRKMKLYGIG
ncbi:MAG: sigma-54-dependent Fis family transcriptional regulator [Nitrospirae bacterium]|nr:MAG: sigma-54-dependent Fis family transcriptional regulator [Nitrospirota bacterium]